MLRDPFACLYARYDEDDNQYDLSSCQRREHAALCINSIEQVETYRCNQWKINHLLTDRHIYLLVIPSNKT